MRFLYSLLLTTLSLGAVFGQSVSFPSPEIQTKAQRPIFVTPTVDGDDLTWDIPDGLDDIISQFPPEVAKNFGNTKMFYADKGVYVIKVRTAKIVGSRPAVGQDGKPVLDDKGQPLNVGGTAKLSKVATLTITVDGGLPPVPPVPPTPPVPPVPPVPPTPPAGDVADFVIGIPDNDARTLQLATILRDDDLKSWLDTNQVKWRVIDIKQAVADTYGITKILADANIKAPAAVGFKGGKLIPGRVASAVGWTSDSVKLFIQGKASSFAVGHDQASGSHFFKDGKERRWLTRSLPEKSVLKRTVPVSRWASANPIIPRDQWKEVNRRAVLPASDWIYDQDGIGSCVGNGSTRALRLTRFLSGMKDIKLSPGCTYSQINGGSDNGANIGDSLTALMSTGTVSYSTVGETPFYTRQLPSNWQTEAKRFRVEEAYTATTFDELISAIQLGYVVVYGMEVGNNYESFTPEGVAGYASGPGNHCMMADGCHRIANGTWVLDNCNSWGATWGPTQNGRCYLTEQHISGADNSDAYVIKAAVEDPQEPIKPGAKLQHNLRFNPYSIFDHYRPSVTAYRSDRFEVQYASKL